MRISVTALSLLLLAGCQSAATSTRSAALVAPKQAELAATASAGAAEPTADLDGSDGPLRDDALDALLRGRTINATGRSRSGRDFRWTLALHADDRFDFSAPGTWGSRGAGKWRVVDDRLCWKIDNRTERCGTVTRVSPGTYRLTLVRGTKWSVPSTFTLS